MRETGLRELYRMNITYATLFPDLDGLARSLAVHTWPPAELFSIYVAMAVVLWGDADHVRKLFGGSPAASMQTIVLQRRRRSSTNVF